MHHAPRPPGRPRVSTAIVKSMNLCRPPRLKPWRRRPQRPPGGGGARGGWWGRGKGGGDGGGRPRVPAAVGPAPAPRRLRRQGRPGPGRGRAAASREGGGGSPSSSFSASASASASLSDSGWSPGGRGGSPGGSDRGGSPEEERTDRPERGAGRERATAGTAGPTRGKPRVRASQGPPLRGPRQMVKKGSERARRAGKRPRGAARRPPGETAEPLREGEAQALYAAFDRAGRGSILRSDIESVAAKFGLEMRGGLLGDMLAFAGAHEGRLSPQQFHLLLGRIEAAGQLRM